MAMWGPLVRGQPSFMHDEARFTRLAMVRLGGGGGGIRRYGLARLDDIALATPPVPRTPAVETPDNADDEEDGTM
jgi:hypothetical protein